LAAGDVLAVVAADRLGRSAALYQQTVADIHRRGATISHGIE